MFSGIIENMAVVDSIQQEGSNLHFTLRCDFAPELAIDQSISHNGVCLTVVRTDGDTYTVTAMQETLQRSNLGRLKPGDKVNVERSMRLDDRLDGHIVQGHVDTTAQCLRVEDADGSKVFTFRLHSTDKSKGYIAVDKGSIAVNGVSLTVCNPTQETFGVAIIPYTLEHTNFCDITEGSIVNIEFDILGKYLARMMAGFSAR